jgi:hypothetical protein
VKEKEFREFLQGREMGEEEIDTAVEAVLEFEGEMEVKGGTLESATVEDLREHISLLMSRGENSLDRLLTLARYCHVAKRNDLYVYFTSILGGRRVLPSISERLVSLVGEEARAKIFEGVETPPLGTPPEELPLMTKRLMDRLEEGLPPEVYRRVLAGNHHRIPLEAFEGLKKLYDESESIDEFLEKKHERAVAELEEFSDEGKIWYEQEITPRVVEFVRGNQEVLGGVRKGDKIYFTKIPYDPDAYLRETDPMMKRYHACHCTLARATILTGEPEINPEWCYCSAGYGKTPYEVVFGEEVEVEMLGNALAGDPRCQFAVKIPDGKSK